MTLPRRGNKSWDIKKRGSLNFVAYLDLEVQIFMRQAFNTVLLLLVLQT